MSKKLCAFLLVLFAFAATFTLTANLYATPVAVEEEAIPPIWSILFPRDNEAIKCNFDVGGTSIGSPTIEVTDAMGIPVQTSSVQVLFDKKLGVYVITVQLCNAGNEDIYITVTDSATGLRKTVGPLKLGENCPACGQNQNAPVQPSTVEPPLAN